jgi:RNAse (barnase) inhibitor barstar
MENVVGTTIVSHCMPANSRQSPGNAPMCNASNSPEFEFDGRDFATLDEFYEVIGRVLIPGVSWGRNLDAFNDILRGGFGTPEGGFVLRWKNSATSREQLGYAETVRQLERRLERCHPSNRQFVVEELERARRGVGPTVFDWIVEIINTHADGGSEQENSVKLMLD